MAARHKLHQRTVWSGQVAARDGFLAPCKSDTLDVLEKNLEAELLRILPGAPWR